MLCRSCLLTYWLYSTSFLWCSHGLMHACVSVVIYILLPRQQVNQWKVGEELRASVLSECRHDFHFCHSYHGENIFPCGEKVKHATQTPMRKKHAPARHTSCITSTSMNLARKERQRTRIMVYWCFWKPASTWLERDILSLHSHGKTRGRFCSQASCIMDFSIMRAPRSLFLSPHGK